MRMTSTFAVLTTLLLAAPVLRASTITVNLGQSAQNYVLRGQGADGTGDGTYFNTQGACTAGASTTTCILTGNYTGTTAGYTSGTYDFITTYLGTGPSLLASQSNGIGSNQFFFDTIPAGTTMFIDLFDTSGNNSVTPIFSGGSFAAGSGFNVAYVAPTCSGTAITAAGGCSQYNVGITPGAVYSGVVTGAVSFNSATAVTAAPEPGLLILGGLPGLFLIMRRRLPARES